MNERDGFLKILAENEDDTTTRLVFADWLDEHGEHEEAENQRKWVAAKEWLVKFCEVNNPAAGAADPYGSYISYETLIGLARGAIEWGNSEDLWYSCRNNRAMCNALREHEADFWKNVAIVTGVEHRTPDDHSGRDPCSHCPWG